MPVRYLIALAGAAVLMAFILGYEKGAESVRQGVAAESVRISEQARQKAIYLAAASMRDSALNRPSGLEEAMTLSNIQRT